MRRALLALLALLALTGGAAAGPDRVLVLPLDGDADPQIRARYSATVQRLARTLGGKVAAGDVTFTDTATAIGCDPKAPACAEDVRATLGVDELIYGAVTKADDRLVLVVRRTAKGKPRREVSATFAPADPPERVEPEILPLFRHGAAPAGTREPTGPAGPTGPSEGAPEAPPEQPPEQPPLPPPASSHKRVLGYAAVGGGGTLLLITLALWASASSMEDEIAAHPVEDRDDFGRLRDLEDAARARAWTGNATFVAALAVGGLGGWLLYRDRKERRAVIAPAPTPDGSGAALVLGGVF